MGHYYDRDGNPIHDIMEFGRLFSDRNYKSIASDDVEDAQVSTVWLGIDHNFSTDGPPLIFETMIFGGDYDEYQWRYATEQEAREGHERIVLALAVGEAP